MRLRLCVCSDDSVGGKSWSEFMGVGYVLVQYLLVGSQRGLISIKKPTSKDVVGA